MCKDCPDWCDNCEISLCSDCENFVIEGGDWVPYSCFSVQLPIYTYCDAPEIPEEIYNNEEAMEEFLKLVKETGMCSYYKKREYKK